MEKKDGGPAFPQVYPDQIVQEGSKIHLHLTGDSGMSLRDWFAGQALIGMLANTVISSNIEDYLAIPGRAYEIADAMLAERSKDA